MPVRVLGLKDFPAPGDDLITVADEEKAKKICALRAAVADKQRMDESKEVSRRISTGNVVSCVL